MGTCLIVSQSAVQFNFILAVECKHQATGVIANLDAILESLAFSRITFMRFRLYVNRSSSHPFLHFSNPRTNFSLSPISFFLVSKLSLQLQLLMLVAEQASNNLDGELQINLKPTLNALGQMVK
jgi:hypothetical protein